MRRVNYYLPYLFKEYLDKKLPNLFWFQIGSAFEYDLSSGELTEDTPSMPLTEYGLTKVMFSDFLKLSSAKNYCILRPFAMFGPYEDETKIVPSLILAQKNKRGIALSNGLQRRDYFYVRDLGSFLENLIIGGLDRISGQTINVGSNRAFSLRDLAAQISVHLSDFNEDYWKWGKIEQRSNENVFFCNASAKCRSLGFVQTGMSEAFIETIDYYYQSLV
jgi:nucleoside-diphosphate-sugar epimerase